MLEPENSIGVVRRMIDKDLPLVLGWRNHAKIRNFMYTQHEISEQEHSGWFERSRHDPNIHLLIYEEQCAPCGFVNFSVSEPSRNAVWGFYSAPEAPKGVGQRMGQAALSYAFKTSGFHKVSGEALANNDKSILFHLSLGFKEEGLLRDHFFNSGNYKDVVCLGLLASDWRRHP